MLNIRHNKGSILSLIFFGIQLSHIFLFLRDVHVKQRHFKVKIINLLFIDFTLSLLERIHVQPYIYIRSNGSVFGPNLSRNLIKSGWWYDNESM